MKESEREIFIIFFFKPTIKFIFPSHEANEKCIFIQPTNDSPVQLSPHHIFSHVTFITRGLNLYIHLLRGSGKRVAAATYNEIGSAAKVSEIEIDREYLPRWKIIFSHNGLMRRVEWVSEWESTGNWFQLINKTWSIYRRRVKYREWMEHVWAEVLSYMRCRLHVGSK